MIRRILDTLAVIAFVAFLPLLAVAQSGVSAISPAPGGGTTPGQGTATTCSVAGALWRTSSPAATLDCSAGLTFIGTALSVTGSVGVTGSVSGGSAVFTSSAIAGSFLFPSTLMQLYPRTNNTPDAVSFEPSAAVNSIRMIEQADGGYDFNNGPCGTSACTDPAFIVHSHNQTTTEYVSIQHNGTNGVVTAGAGSVQFASLGIKLITGSKPTCDSATRGTLFYVAGGAGVADTYEVCVKDAGDAYAWTAIF